jgi:hypothetical protein
MQHAIKWLCSPQIQVQVYFLFGLFYFTADMPGCQGEEPAWFAGAMNRLLGPIEHNLLQLTHRVTGLEQNVAGLGGRLNGVEARLAGLEGRLDGVEARLAGLEGQLDGVSHRLEILEASNAAIQRLLALVKSLTSFIHCSLKDQMQTWNKGHPSGRDSNLQKVLFPDGSDPTGLVVCPYKLQSK